MTAPSNATILENIQTAINNIMSGGAVQKYSMPDGRNLQHFSLDELMRLEKYYSNKVAASTSAGKRTYVDFRRPI